MDPSDKQQRERIVTISNGLSLFRVFLTAPLIWALEVDNMRLILILVVLAVLSDFFDGYLARRAHAITNLGKLLDPIADKFIMLAVMIFLIMDVERRFPILFFVLLGIRDISISIIATYLMDRKKQVFETNRPGKWFVGVSTLAMTLYILRLTQLGFWVLMVATVLLLISWTLYIRFYVIYFKLPDAE